MFDISKFSEEEIDKLLSKYAASAFAALNRDIDGTPLHGVYEDQKYFQRKVFLRGVMCFVVSKQWVESTDIDKPDLAKLPWGSYPDIPRKK